MERRRSMRIRRRRRRVGEDDGGGADRISDLPDAVLGEIISLLPTKEGARTRILASRWRHLWCTAPLNLDCGGLVKQMDRLHAVVLSILSSHQGPGRRFCTAPGGQTSLATLDAWLQSRAVHNLQELYLCYPTDYHLLPQLQVQSASIFRLSTTLRVVTIEKCHLPDNISSQGLQFPQLKHLALKVVRISECSLHHVIAGCPALECLLIYESFGFGCVRISSVSMRSIGVRAQCYRRDELKCGELVIENAPSLQRLLHLVSNSDLRVSVIFAPKLETLCCHSNPHTKISFGSMVIRGLRLHSLTTAVHSIKILAVDMDILSLDRVIDMMRCFPCLEKLYIQSCNTGESNLWLRKHKNLIRCHDIRLKKVVLEWYWGIKSQINFVKFFLLNANVLDSMTLHIEPKNYNDQFMEDHRRKLQLENRASRGAQLQFTADACVRDIREFKDVNYLDLADPFAC